MYVDDIKVKKWAETVVNSVRLLSNMVTDTVERSTGGLTFVIGDTDRVLERSFFNKQHLLDEIPSEHRNINSPYFVNWLYANIKNIDGAIIVTEFGDVKGIGYVLPVGFKFSNDKVISDYITLHKLGSRHMSAINISIITNAVAVVASEELSIRIFHKGRPIKRLKPFVGLVASEEEEKLMDDSPLSRNINKAIGTIIYASDVGDELNSALIKSLKETPTKGDHLKLNDIVKPEVVKVDWEDKEHDKKDKEKDSRDDVMFQ